MDSNPAISNEKRLPAEWETQVAVQLTWPHEDTDWKPILKEINATYASMAAEIARREKLIIVTPEPQKAIDVIKEHTAAENDREKIMKNIYTLECPTDDTWARDHGFITIAGNYGDKTMIDFCFNGWGRKFKAEKDNAINRKLYSSHLFNKKGSVLNGEYSDRLDFVLEGGSIESDGRGTVFTTTKCLLAPNRNQPMTQDDIDNMLKRTLCAERVVWIDYGSLEGDDTDGHIDTLVRIAPADTLLYIGCDNENDGQYKELCKMEEQLRSLHTKSGSSYRLLRLPMPEPIYHNGKEFCNADDKGAERLPATYANFLVINGAVLYPTYGQPLHDREAAEIIAEAFPDREIIGIDCRNIIIQHGSLHCCTMQFFA